MITGLFKMQGAGNDFLLGIGDWAKRLEADPDTVRFLCDRHRGVGADGTLALRKRSPGSVSLLYRNADGSEGEFCANGTRVAARAAVDLLGCRASVEISTGWAVIPAEVRGQEVSLLLPPPRGPVDRPGIQCDVSVGDIIRLDVGVPHLVVPVSRVAELDLPTEAPALRSHRAVSPEGANVNFYEIGDGDEVTIRTWERGVEAETLSCGSGMVAVALLVMAGRGSVRAVMRPASGDRVTVEALGDPPLCSCRLTGPTRMVAEIQPLEELFADL